MDSWSVLACKWRVLYRLRTLLCDHRVVTRLITSMIKRSAGRGSRPQQHPIPFSHWGDETYSTVIPNLLQQGSVLPNTASEYNYGDATRQRLRATTTEPCIELGNFIATISSELGCYIRPKSLTCYVRSTSFLLRCNYSEKYAIPQPHPRLSLEEAWALIVNTPLWTNIQNPCSHRQDAQNVSGSTRKARGKRFRLQPNSFFYKNRNEISA
jgi:hypothetical protein